MESLGNVRVQPDFWQGKHVFITGHTGFKGGWLALWVHRLGAEVHGYALDPETRPNLFETADVRKTLVSDTRADICDGEALRVAMQKVAPHIVIHMAAQPLVRRSYRDPVQTYASNVMGTVHLLEAVRRTPGVEQVLVITSDKCYENRERAAGYREDEPLGGFDPYSSSKACAEIVTAAYRESFFENGARIGLATARAGNVIGGGDWSEDRLIPDMVRAWRRNETVRIRQPQAVRPWQHVLEALRGYLLLIERLAERPHQFSSAWNFGPEEQDTRPVAWMVSRFAEAWGGGKWQKDTPADGLHEAGLLRLDCSKAHQMLDWHPVLHVEEGVDWTAAWYRAFEDGADMYRFTIDQIQEFEARVA